MKIQLNLEIEPFSVPSHVLSEEDTHGEHLEIPLSDLTPEALDKLCREFESAVFKQAGKLRLPQDAQARTKKVTCPECSHTFNEDF